MVGPPGAGKTMLASRLPGILPPLDHPQRVESALVHSVAGLSTDDILSGSRPFRAPHHSVTTAGLCGGGTPARPGEASLAHHGVLFLDELPLFAPSTLQALRQPAEDGRVLLARAEGIFSFPARFTLVAAANPCACGFLGDESRSCTCPPHAIERYQSRVGGPLLDRIDIHLRVSQERMSTVLSVPAPKTSVSIRDRVCQARCFARERRPAVPATLAGAALLDAAALSSSGRACLTALADAGTISSRGVTRLTRVARTIADLDLSETVLEDHVDEAFSLRGPDRAGALV
jgi:magnesium chelatase family protein